MATIKLVSLVGRDATVDVTWSNGWKRTFVIPNSPVESFEQTQAHFLAYITAIYGEVEREEAEKAYRNPTVAPEVLAAVGHTFDDQGNVLS